MTEVLKAKQAGGVRPSAVMGGVPADLDELCVRLLDPDPGKRPATAEVLKAFGREAVAARPTEVPLVGRGSHLAALRESYDRLLAGSGAVVVELSGPSGVGKSALVSRFTAGLRYEDALVLAGRCYEHESVPYKALDPVVDELARFLHSLGEDASRFVPEYAAALLRVFPVLERSRPFEVAARDGRISPDAQETRRQAFAALREVLGKLAGAVPLVVHVDDLQWGDVDSAYLLSDLIRPSGEPRVLWLLSHRSEDAESACLKTLSESLERAGVEPVSLPVEPLDEAESRELALAVLGGDAGRAGEIAKEAGGNPFFVAELARAASADLGENHEGLTLDGLIRRRAGGLAEGPRRLLELVAVSGRPLGDADAFRAAQATDDEDVRAYAAVLEAGRLLRGVGEAGAIRLETYHDRVREAVIAGLTSEALRGHHGRLANVLEESGRGDLEELAGHFEGAGEAEKAGGYYYRAGDQSAQSMAFDQAVGFYRKALDILQLEGPEVHELRTKLAQALADAGRSEESGPMFLAVAEGLEGLEGLDMRRRAMEQLMTSYHTEQGFQTVRELLEITGYRWPGGPKRALIRTIWELVRLRLRGSMYREKSAEEIPAEKLWELDVVYACGCRVSHLDMIVGTGLMARAGRLSLKAGEPRRILRSFACGAMLLSWGGGKTRRTVEKWLAKANDLLGELNDPYWTAYYEMKLGLVHWGFGEWKKNLEAMDRSEESIRSGQRTLIFFRTEVRFTMLHSLMLQGRWNEFADRGQEYQEEAKRMGNRYAVYALLTKSYLVSLIRGNPEKALSDIQAGQDAWGRPGNFLGDFQRFYGRVESRLYSGDAVGAEIVFTKEEQITVKKVLQQSRMLEPTFLLMEHLWGRVKLALAEQASPGGRLFGKRAKLLRGVTRHARTIEKRNMPWSNPLAKLLRAGVANLRGDPEAAVANLADAEAGFDAADMAMYAAAARRQRGRLLGGDEGRELVASADAFMTSEGVVEPERIAAMLAPGFPD